MWAGVSDDYTEFHYDKDFAQNAGLPGVIVQGQLAFSFLSQLMTNWIGELGSLRKLSCNYRGMNFPGEALTCKGKVERTYIEKGKHFVECYIWIENPRGEVTLSGIAVAIVPSRS
jgi:acyl dehydratase